MAANDLTAQSLREVLDYNPLTGLFRWRVCCSNRAPIGTPAGVPPAKGYARIEIDGRRYFAHRLAWLHVHGRWPRHGIDHRDRNPGNNRLKNLRDATHNVNNQNRAVRLGCSGRRGVSRNAKGWQVRVWFDGTQRAIGTFPTVRQAAQVAHDARAIFYPGYPATQTERGRAIVRVLNRASKAARTGL